MSLKGIFPIENWHFNSQAIFAALSEEDRTALLARSRKEKYNKGTIIFREGGIPVGIYYIESGKVKKYKIDNSGREHIFYVANAGELIGYHAVLADEHYHDAASAIEDSVLDFIPVADFLSVLDSSSDLSRKLLKTLSHEFGVFVNGLAISAQKPVRERVAITLIVLREKYKHQEVPEEPVVISISRDDIANMAGTTRENIARILTDFKREGIVDTIGWKIMITDVNKLIAVSNY